jgi:hypothetical protein
MACSLIDSRARGPRRDPLAPPAGRRRPIFILVFHRALPDLQRMKHKPDQAFGHREVFCFFLVFHRALPDLQRMKHKPDQAFGHREVFLFLLSDSGSGRTMELARSGRTIMRPGRRGAGERRPRATGSSANARHRKISAIGRRYPYSRRILARAREAVFRSRRRRPDAERPAIRPTRSSRLGGASAISFSRYSASLGRTLVAAAAAPGARWIGAILRARRQAPL